jgi:hypothetical protein
MNTYNHPNLELSSSDRLKQKTILDESFNVSLRNESASNDDNINIPLNCRPRNFLAALAKRYPDAWKQVDQLRGSRGNGLPMWPDWCFLPISYAFTLASDKIDIGSSSTDFIKDTIELTALAAWRVTQGIYRFDSAVYRAVRNTPIDGDIPCDVLQRLPEWCIYLETPEQTYGDEVMHGAWIHLEWDANTHRQELRILADLDSGTIPIILHLGKWSLEEALNRAILECNRNIPPELNNIFGGLFSQMQNEVKKINKTVIEPIISLLLYLCSQASEIGDGQHLPKYPVAKRVRGEMRMYPPNTATTWDVGVRMGAALRRAEKCSSPVQGGTHTSPRPHIRRAHWHGFRYGPTKGLDGTNIATIERKFELQWLPPIAVNLTNVDDLVATVRAVS